MGQVVDLQATEWATALSLPDGAARGIVGLQARERSNRRAANRNVNSLGRLVVIERRLSQDGLRI